jgi:flavin prenyltransferase
MRKIVVAITGASGSIYAQQLLNELVLRNNQIAEIAVIFSEQGQQVWEYELGKINIDKHIKQYNRKDFFAPFASGSAGYDTLIVIPCSMGTLGRIANGISDDLITRTADVMLKERKKLILVPREMPYNLIHIKNMQTLTEAGAIICPASPSFYSLPQTLEELTKTVITRVLSLAGFEGDGFKWGNQ